MRRSLNFSEASDGKAEPFRTSAGIARKDYAPRKVSYLNSILFLVNLVKVGVSAEFYFQSEAETVDVNRARVGAEVGDVERGFFVQAARDADEEFVAEPRF